jgi:hypothetical protein
VGADEDVLHDVLGVQPGAAQELGGVAAQRALVAPDDRREGLLVACAGGRDELCLAAPEQGEARPAARGAVIVGFHVTMML